MTVKLADRRRSWLVGALLVAGALAGCAQTGPTIHPPTATASGAVATSRKPAGEIPSLTVSSSDPAANADSLPPGWEQWILHPSKARTRYRLEKGESGLSMRADADCSASGLMVRLQIDPSAKPILEWRWKVQSLIEGADNADRYAEDAPVRVVLAFDGDKHSLSFKEQSFFERVKLFGGQDMPYATLMYIWENRKPVGTIIENPHTSRVRKMVVASGPQGLQQWKSFRRNIVEDYRKAFGKPPPGKLIGVAILTDTDNTSQRVTAWYGDIKLKADPAP